MQRDRVVLLVALLVVAAPAAARAIGHCAPAPRADCRRSQSGRLLMRRGADPLERHLIWAWRHGQATALADLADPQTTANYGLCVYAGAASSLLFEATVPAGSPGWRPIRGGFRYSAGAPGAGIGGLLLQSAESGESRGLVVGRLGLSQAMRRVPLPVTVQLDNAATGTCWESLYSADNHPRNGERSFHAVQEGVPPPNVVVINTDDQRWDSLVYMPIVLQQTVAKGVTFANAFVPNPVCTPSRASFLTGNHSHTHGILGVGTPARPALHFFGPDRRTIPVWLQAAGYQTGMFGKYLGGWNAACGASGCPIAPGWNEWRALIEEDYYDYRLAENEGIVSHAAAPQDYSTDVLRDEVLAFLDTHRRDPVFVYFAPVAPHGSISRSYLPVPAPRHFDSLLGLPLRRPPSYLEADVADKPAWIRAKAAMLTPTETAYYDASRRKALESLRAVDEAVGAILKKLEEQERLTDTLVIFTSDNGFSNLEHRVFGKLCAYEECNHVPLVLRYPRLLRDQAATRRSLVSVVDLAPTIAEWARVPAGVVPPLDGRSIAALARGDASGWADAILLEQWEEVRYAGVRTRGWKYIAYDTGEQELYDLARDPLELRNVADLYPAMTSQLAARIVDLGGTIP